MEKEKTALEIMQEMCNDNNNKIKSTNCVIEANINGDVASVTFRVDSETIINIDKKRVCAFFIDEEEFVKYENSEKGKDELKYLYSLDEAQIQIPRVFLSPFQIETSEFSDFITGVEQEDLNEMELPIDFNDFMYDHEFGERDFMDKVKEHIIDNKKFGIFAEIDIPKLKVYSGDSFAATPRGGICSCYFVFAKNTEELFEKTMNLYNNEIEKAKEKFNENKEK